LKLKCDKLLSNFAFSFNLCPYNVVVCVKGDCFLELKRVPFDKRMESQAPPRPPDERSTLVMLESMDSTGWRFSFLAGGYDYREHVLDRRCVPTTAASAVLQPARHYKVLHSPWKVSHTPMSVESLFSMTLLPGCHPGEVPAAAGHGVVAGLPAGGG